MTGAQVVHVGGASLCALTAAIVDAIAPVTTKRSACRTLGPNSHGTDVDPEVVIDIEKFVLLRRVLSPDAELKEVVTDIEKHPKYIPRVKSRGGG